MIAKITFPATENRGTVVLKSPSSVTVDKSWKTLTDTATITMARKVRDFDKQKVRDIFRYGDPVIIELGINGIYHKEFEGYIIKVSADIPIVIECEDEMHRIHKVPVNASFPNTNLQGLLKTLLPTYNIDALEVEIGAVRFAKTNMGKVLEFLKDDYSLYSYMKGKELIVGKVYADDSDVQPIPLNLERDLANNSLKYRHREDIVIRINAVSTLSDGTKIEVTVGDEDGEERQLTYYAIGNTIELEKLANEDIKKYKIDGFNGSIKTFARPIIEHGNKVKLTSTIYPDRNGTYYVERVKINFDDSPQYRRTIELGDKVA